MKKYKVYVIYSNNYRDYKSKNGFIKIGITSNLNQRIKNIEKKESLTNIQVIHEINCKSREMACCYEYYFHNKFKDKKIDGEWFKYYSYIDRYFAFNKLKFDTP